MDKIILISLAHKLSDKAIAIADKYDKEKNNLSTLNDAINYKIDIKQAETLSEIALSIKEACDGK